MKIFLIFLFNLLILGKLLSQDDNKYLINWQLIDYTTEENFPMIKECINKGANLNFRNENGATPLMIAVENGNLEYVKYFLSLKADPNITTFDQFSPLMMSVFKGNLDLTELLIQSKADINAKDNYGASALCYSAAFGDFVMSDMLIFYGANPQIKTNDNSNLLHIAAFTNDTLLSALFLQKGVDINAINNRGFSPLMIATQNKFILLTEYLLNNNANPSYVDSNGYGALAIALYNRSNLISKKLLSNPDYKYIPQGKSTNNPLAIAKHTHQYTFARELRKKGIRLPSGFIVDELNFQFELIPNFTDHFFRFASGFHELNSGIDLNFGYQNRLKQKQVYKNLNGNDYILWEHRTNLDIDISRNFRIGNDESRIYVSTGVDFVYSFGYYNGLKQKIPNTFLLNPEIGILYSRKYMNLGLIYTYTPYDFIDISNHRVKFSVTFKIPLFIQPEKYMLTWML